MRVLHVIPAVADRYGGPSRLVVEMCRALKEKSIDAEIATTNADGAERIDVALDQLVDYRGVPARFFRRDFSEAFKYSRDLAGWLQDHVADYDLVHIHAVFSHAPLSASWSCRRSGVPYIVRPLGTLDPWSMGVKAWRKKLFWQLGARRMLHNAAAVQYTTEMERREVETLLDLSGGVVIPNAVDAAALQGNLPDDEFALRFPELAGRSYILFLGRLHPKKNLELLIETFTIFSKQDRSDNPSLLVLAGDGETGYREQLMALAAGQPAGERILFPGWLNGVEKKALLRRARLFALPSMDENFGISVVEAMACGVPVLVSTGVYLHGEIARADAGWVWNGDNATLSGLLQQALQSENRKRKGDRGKRLVDEKFSWPVVVERLQTTYRKAIDVE